MLFLTALITGMVSSLHCAGMCGPIAFALPKVANNPNHLWVSRLLYNAGRIFTYSLLGFIIGSIGFQLKLAGLQQSISILAGVAILIITLTKLFLPKIANTINLNFWGKKWYGKLFSSNKMYSFFLIGNLNGLLPCGFVYVALIASLATQSALSGAMFMASFGLGTFPVMFAISLLGQVINLKLRKKANLLMPVFTIVLGCIFILRGLNLGIPFVSPQIDNTEVSGNYCGPQH